LGEILFVPESSLKHLHPAHAGEGRRAAATALDSKQNVAATSKIMRTLKGPSL